MSPRYNAPVSSFGAELHAALRHGAQKEIKLRFETSTLAKRFMHRINHLRAAMKKENHTNWEQLYRCGVHIDRRDPCALILAPRDSEFRAALSSANIGPEPLPTLEIIISTPSPEQEGAAPSSAVENFLSELTNLTSVAQGLAPPREATPPPKNTTEDK